MPTKEELERKLRNAASQGEVDYLEKHFKSLDLNAKGKNSQKTALHFAAQQGQNNVVNFLLQQDVKLDEQDAQGDTPLTIALSNQHFDTALLLVNANCKTELKNKEGKNALTIAQSLAAPDNFIARLKEAINQNRKLLQLSTQIAQWLSYNINPSNKAPKIDEFSSTSYRLSLGKKFKTPLNITKVVLTDYFTTSIAADSGLITPQRKSAFMLLSFKDKSKLGCSLPFSAHELNNRYFDQITHQTYKTMTALGASIDRSHAQRDNRITLNWAQQRHRGFYQDIDMRYHEKAHLAIADLLANALREKEQPLEIFSFGCGDGSELVTIKKSFADAKSPLRLVGFDINPANFPTKRDPAITLLPGDATGLDALMEKASYQEEAYKVGLFIGLLVDGCMQGTYPALKTIQQARMMNRIIIGNGKTNGLLSKTTLKAAGFSVNLSQKNLDHEDYNQKGQVRNSDIPGEDISVQTWFDLTPMPTKERKDYLINRGKKRSSAHVFDCLDLSMSADPLKDWLRFNPEEFTIIKQVDISWSYLKLEEIAPLMNVIQTLQRPIHLLFSPHQVHAQDIISLASSYSTINLVERLDENSPFECPRLAPQEIKGILYDKLPCRSLKK